MRYLLISIFILFVASLSYSATINVPGDQLTIQAGIDAAVNGDTVLVDNGVYTGDGNRDLDPGGKAIVLKSANGADFAVIDCEGTSGDPHRGFFFHSGEANTTIIDGFKIENGYGFDNGQGRSIGGGIYCDSSSSPTFIDCVIHRNQAGWGSGMYCLESSPQMINCTFSENGYDISSSGGGLYCKYSSPILTGCKFRENRADEGSPGGGFHCWLSTATLTDCTFMGNWAYSGGAVSAYWATITMTGCVFLGNRTESYPYVVLTWGGGLYVYNSDATLTNCTFAENGAYALGEGGNGYGGAVAISSLPDYSCTMQNCIVAFNEGDDAVSCFGDPPSAINVICCDIFGNQGGDWIGCLADLAGIDGNFSADPLFCDRAGGDFRIDEASPAMPENNDCGEWIGAFEIGCGATPVVLESGMANEEANHVINNIPIFWWEYACPLGNPEDSFNIAVGTDDDWQYAEMWDPAPFPGPDTSITYAGAALVDGETYYLRLRVHNGLAWSDWYEMSFRMNSRPSVPVAISPGGGEVIVSATPTLYLENSIDPESDLLTYDYFVLDDSEYVYAEVFGVEEQTDSTGWMVDIPLIDNMPYIWYVRAHDGYEYSEWSLVEWIWVNSSEDVPTEFDLSYPPDTGWSQVYDIPTEFRWHYSYDPDPMDSVYYRLIVSVDSEFIFTSTYDSIYAITYLVPSLNYNTHYWWKVYAIDTKGNMTQSSGVADFMTWVLGDANRSYSVGVGDVVFLIKYIFRGGEAPYPLKIGDVNGDCSIEIVDPVYLITYIFKCGPAPLVGCAE